MSENVGVLQYYEKAKMMLEERDYTEFVKNIGIAEFIAERQEKDFLGKVTFLVVKGFYEFNQYKKCLEFIPHALKYNSGRDLLRIKHYEGIQLGFIGELDKAMTKFKILLGDVTDDFELSVELYISIAWVYLLSVRLKYNQEYLNEVKKYLDSAFTYIDLVSDTLRVKIYGNYSVYYFYLRDYEKSIEMINLSLKYCQEVQLPQIYNNIADVYLHGKDDENSIEEILEKVYSYLKKAEILASKYNDTFSMGLTHFNKARAELLEDQFYKALDSLHVAFDYFTEAEAYTYAFDCWVKINKIMEECKVGHINSISDFLGKKLKGTPFYNKV